VAVSLVIWLAFLLSAALTTVGVQFPFMAATDAAAATNLPCATASCGSSSPNDYSYTPAANSWIVVGARATTQSNDPRLCLYSDAAFTQQRACSNTGTNATVEFAVVDHHHTPAVTGYARSERVSGTGEICTQLDCGATVLNVTDAPLNLTWTAGSVVRMFNLPVVAGGTYHVYFVVTSGSANLGLALFDSHGQANYSTGRGGAVAQADIRGAGQGEGLVFAATATDTLGLVLWSNTAAGTANYRIEYRTDTKLVANSAQSFPGTDQKNFFAVPGNPRGWSVIACKPTVAVVSTDADIRLYDQPDNLNQLGRSSAEAGIVDFIVANYANVPEDSAYVLMVSLGPLGTYKMDWATGEPTLAQGVTEILDLASHGRVGEGRAVQLVANVEYQFVFDPLNNTFGDAAVGLYGPRASEPAFTYGTRVDSLAGSDVWGETAVLGGWAPGQGVEEFLFTPTITGQYYVYTYQKRNNGVAGELRYFPTSLLGVDPVAPPAVALAAPWPSPARAGSAIHFRCTMATASDASLSIVDAAGRRVRQVFDGLLAAGVTTLTWDGRTDEGARAGPGIYFAYLKSDQGLATRRMVWFR